MSIALGVGETHSPHMHTELQLIRISIFPFYGLPFGYLSIRTAHADLLAYFTDFLLSCILLRILTPQCAIVIRNIIDHFISNHGARQKNLSSFLHLLPICIIPVICFFTVSARYDFPVFNQPVLTRISKPPPRRHVACDTFIKPLDSRRIIRREVDQCAKVTHYKPYSTIVYTPSATSHDLTQTVCLPTQQNSQTTFSAKLSISHNLSGSVSGYVHPMDHIWDACQSSLFNCSSLSSVVSNSKGDTVLQFKSLNKELVIRTQSNARPGVTAMTEAVRLFLKHSSIQQMTEIFLGTTVAMRDSVCYVSDHVVRKSISNLLYLEINLYICAGILVLIFSLHLTKSLPSVLSLPQYPAAHINDVVYQEAPGTIDVILSQV